MQSSCPTAQEGPVREVCAAIEPEGRLFHSRKQQGHADGQNRHAQCSRQVLGVPGVPSGWVKCSTVLLIRPWPPYCLSSEDTMALYRPGAGVPTCMGAEHGSASHKATVTGQCWLCDRVAGHMCWMDCSTAAALTLYPSYSLKGEKLNTNSSGPLSATIICMTTAAVTGLAQCAAPPVLPMLSTTLLTTLKQS